jgi:hypothetical protein
MLLTRRVFLGGVTGAASSQQHAPSIRVVDLTKSSPQVHLVRQYIERLALALSEQQQQDFGGAISVGRWMRDLVRHDYLAVGRILPDTSGRVIAAFVGVGNTDVPSGYAALIVNSDGAFFRKDQIVAGVQGASDEARLRILLHEAGHGCESPHMRPDFHDPVAQARNDANVEFFFGDTIRHVMLALRQDRRNRSSRSLGARLQQIR